MRYGFGVDVGGTTVKIAWFDETGTLLEKWEIPTVVADGGKAILPDVAASIHAFLEKKQVSREQILGIGLGVPGPVDRDGVVNECHNLGWGVFNVQRALEELTGLPVRAGNDANVAALGEAWKGGGAGSENSVMVTLGTGVGGGIIINGRPVCGQHGAAGEIGHMVLRRDEPEACNCGKHGCVEQFCSATGIARLATRYLNTHEEPSVLRTPEKLTAKDVFDGAKAGDAAAEAILDQVFDYMGEFLGSLCAVVDPEVVVIGGGVSRAGQALLDGAQRYYGKYAFPACRGVKFALASLGNDAGAYGAFKLVLDALS